MLGPVTYVAEQHSSCIETPRSRAVLAQEGQPEGPQFDWTSIPSGVYVGAAIVISVLLLLLLVAGLLAYRRVKRTGSWRRMSLTVQAEALGPGARRDLARLRLRLDDAINSLASATTAARDAGAAGDLEMLAAQLTATGTRLAQQLDLLADAVNEQTLKGVAPMLTEQVETIDRLASQLVQAAARAVMGASSVELDQLTGAVSDELKMVGYRVDALRELSEPKPASAPPETR